MGRLQLSGVDKTFGAARALASVDLELGPGEILGVTGPSGAGKSTLCRIVSGLEAASAGEILIDGQPVGHVSPERRGVAFMFESYALYPHLSVFDNVAFPLRAPGVPRLARPEIAARVRAALGLVEIDDLEARRPAELSGGQRQRVALCRALVQEPRAYLLDEPLSHLDAKLRHLLRGAIRRRLTATATPTIWTSPDALEALAVGDRVAVLIDGRVRQLGPPEAVYRKPATVEVARLLGDPPMNLIEGALAGVGRELRFQHAAFSLPLPAALTRVVAAEPGAVVLGLRPAEIEIGDDGGADARGEVWVWEPLGKHGIVSVRIGTHVVKVKAPAARRFRPGEPVALRMRRAEPALFDAATGLAI